MAGVLTSHKVSISFIINAFNVAVKRIYKLISMYDNYFIDLKEDMRY